MGLLTIGTFAKASRLSPKALRLYDELGLLTPDQVDPNTGYRLYAPEQLERARLLAWLRRLGMPLARIREMSDLAPAEAVIEVRAFLAWLEADTAARRDLATFLINHLSGEEPVMPTNGQSLAIRYAALSDVGLVRKKNQDVAYAGSRLLAVADGFGGRGADASKAVINILKRLETDSFPAGSLLNVLYDTIEEATQAVNDMAEDASSFQDVGTTLTAMLWTGSQLALVHIGDSRAYLLRDRELFQITHDHTLVQSMVDEGRLTEEEATSWPQRSLLLRALTAGTDVSPDVHVQDVQPGDRFLLCSDGLSNVVPTEEAYRVLSDILEPEHAVRELVTMANSSGGPDNISCVVADVLCVQR